MKISEMKQALTGLTTVSFRLPEGTLLPPHFHVTEVGLVTKHFVDCGGTERRETTANFQLWEAGDYDHRLAPQKFLGILKMAEKTLGLTDDLAIEVEYQQATIGKFGLAFDGTEFALMPKQTACLAQDACGIPAGQFALPQLQAAACTPGGSCC